MGILHVSRWSSRLRSLCIKYNVHLLQYIRQIVRVVLLNFYSN